MAKSPFDKLKDAATGAIGVGRSAAGKAAGRVVRTAGPVASTAAGAVRSRLTHRHQPTPARTSSPMTDPAAPTAPADAAPPATRVATPDPAAPAPQKTPGTSVPKPSQVAKNIPKHPPTKKAAPPAKTSARKSAPGAKLPPRKSAAEPTQE